VQALGSISYLVAPALGPFIYEQGASAYSTNLEHGFLLVHQAILAGGTRWLGDNTGAFLTSGLGAMPSLHIAIAVVFLYYAQRHGSWLAWIYWPALVWIGFEAMASRWHYGIDLVFGFALSAVCIFLAGLWLRAHERAMKPGPVRLEIPALEEASMGNRPESA
jgi:membrane-associated phospholipid phosphatase